jgi:hypothetical protein
VSVRGHLTFLAVATVAWAAVWLAGWPDYYQSWSTSTLVALSALLLVPFFAGGWWYLRRPGRTSRTRRAVLLAFYCTVPIFLYDYAYCGLYVGHGVPFIVRYWYLTTYYVIPWLMYPATARWLDAIRALDARAGGGGVEAQPGAGEKPNDTAK